ncbi:iron export ABC transporter permease subunit FetB [Thiorhodococcus mannitoliphagus]|uniref:Iron export ABC transporter permease subunit FetB n=1 Tax=Thiorhodococcus mannitoliphagus TaxID=329406 RepID=A0A6P1DWB4_9GAMM|nr:iron export ABC transporter permease subunit FetB [Thiorhodococcus mannitoliphagus]NEX21433.1 iron export ABC transporter permease subunit FetB [Thiorhodococcus mannitoliphagus]
MTMIHLSPWDLGVASILIFLLAGMSWRLKLGVERRVLVAAARSAVQLTLVGMVLKLLFAQTNLALIGLMALVMLSVAGFEVMQRQKRRYRGGWGYGIGAFSMFLSSFSVTLMALTVVIGVEPWYQPQYLIPLLGMMLGNTMNGVAIALDNLTRHAWESRGKIEARLLSGQGWETAIQDIRRDALRSGLIPIVNAMGTAGLVSLPGMMTGQILAGSPPMEAAKYQLLIMFLISGGTGLGSMAAVWLGSRRLFDDRQRLRLDRLMSGSRD